MTGMWRIRGRHVVDGMDMVCWALFGLGMDLCEVIGTEKGLNCHDYGWKQRGGEI